MDPKYAKKSPKYSTWFMNGPFSRVHDVHDLHVHLHSLDFPGLLVPTKEGKFIIFFANL